MLMAFVLTRLFRSRARLEAEILVLRQQINVLRRKSPKRPSFSNFDRLLFVWLSRLVPTTLDALTVVRPETVIGWHRAGFRAYWRWKSRPRAGRPKKPLQIRQLIRDMSIANPLWGAPRIHGELLKLGIDVGQTTVAKYMARRRRPPVPGLEDVPAQSRGWHRVDGFIRGSDDLVPFVVWVCDPATSPPRDPIAGCHRASNRRMAGPSGHRGLRMGEYATLHSSRRGRHLWRRVGPASSRHGHPGSADRRDRHGRTATAKD